MAAAEPRRVDAGVSAGQFAALMAPLGPFGPAPRLAAGVSGGPHSLALALLADAWARARGGALLAFIVDHGLRPDSGAEAARVAARLAGRGIAARILPLGLSGGAGLHERARIARLDALLAACGATGTPWLLLGHHRDDQAETLLARALAGSGPDGLAAMPAARAAAEALILRPLLGLAPVRLEAVVAAAGLLPERDASNADPRFLRARLRAALGEDAAGHAALAEAAAGFGRRRAGGEAAVAARLALGAILSPLGHASIDPGRLGADATGLAAFGLLLRLVGGGTYPPEMAAAAALLARGRGTLAGCWLRPGPRGALLLLREPGAVASPVAACRGARWDGRFRLLGPGAAGHTLGALGPEAPGAAGRLPAALRRALPAIRDQQGALAALPWLDYPDRSACLPFTLAFAPAGGAALGWASGEREATGHPFKPGRSVPI
ncbi:MAG TPA: tRNA lysidine(34) synthetase TilS [Roseomonas sp.]|jgi:tRNA(Ile)-lysidine synthase